MKPFGRTVWGGASVLVAMLAVGLLVTGTYSGPASAGTPSVFVSFDDSDFPFCIQAGFFCAGTGVAATLDKLLVTQPFCSDPRRVVSITSSGNVTVFATLPPLGVDGCREEYIGISPGLGGFPAGYVYVTQGPNILKITPDGTSVTPFVTIPSLGPSHTGITFDRVGTFGNDMIVTGFDGQVWRVNSSAGATLVATVPPVGNVSSLIEGPEVAPLTFEPYGGHVLVASESTSRVFAVSPSGAVSTVASWPDAEGVYFISPGGCSFGASNGAFFTVAFPTHIAKFPPSDFTGLGGSALVTSEGGGGIGLLTSTGGGVTVSTFHPSVGNQEGSAFVQCPEVPVSIDIKPGSFPNSINLGSGGTVPVAILSSATFNATTVDPITVTLASAPVKLKGKGTPMASSEDVNGDNLLDLVVHVSTDALQLSEADTQATLKGQTFSGTSITGTDTVRVVP